ncbi:MAG: LysM peptidoglycan-binding domain-containing protein [Desulfobacterales bacterium]
MTARALKIAGLLILVLAQTGCVALQKVPVNVWQVQPVDITKYRENADAFEQEGEFEAALLYWKVIRSLEPGNIESAGQIERLQNLIRDRSEAHFQKGLAALKAGGAKAAQGEFLKALQINSQHEAALNHLIRHMDGDRYRIHRVKPGETLQSIARGYYKDRGKAVLIARYNDLDPSASPPVGAVLKVPVVEPKPVPRKPHVKHDLEAVKQQLEEGDFQSAADTLEDVLADTPGNAEARNLYHSALFDQAKRLREQQRYPEAMAMLQKIDAEWPGVQTAISDLSRVMINLAEDHYRLGVKYFVKEELELAIREWETALTLNPDHPKAADGIAEASRILEALKRNRQEALPRQ